MNTEKLKQVTIAGYRSISFDLPVELELRDINILLGANGAGKSNIVSFFRMLGYMMGESLQKHVAQAGTNQNFLHYGPKKTPKISASIRFEGDNSYDTYYFDLTAAVPNSLIISTEKIEWKDEFSESGTTLKSDFYETGLNKDETDQSKRIRELLSRCKVYQFSDSSQFSPMRQASAVDSAQYLQSEANNLASFLLYLKNNYKESYERISSYVRGVVPQFKEFYLEPERGYVTLKWRDTSPNDYILSADQFSDGSIRFISLVTLLLQPAQTMPSVIIIDEPELGLHPYAIDQLAEIIKDASLHAQVIVATQSPSLINGFDIDDVIIMERNEEHQSSVAKRLNKEDYEEWLRDYTFSELWDKNVIGGRP